VKVDVVGEVFRETAGNHKLQTLLNSNAEHPYFTSLYCLAQYFYSAKVTQ